MNPAIAKHQTQLIELCPIFLVQRLELFGSGLSDAFNPGVMRRQHTYCNG
jgi:hypothetical protein